MTDEQKIIALVSALQNVRYVLEQEPTELAMENLKRYVDRILDTELNK